MRRLSALLSAGLQDHSGGLRRAVDEAERLVLAAESHALMLAELGDIELPPAAQAAPMQMRAVASLYLASTLEAAGIIQAADDFARLVRTGALPADLGDAAELVATFWQQRTTRTSTDERLALFARLFGAPAGPVDAATAVNDEFEERLLDLCDAIIDASKAGNDRKVRATAGRLADNIGGSATDFALLMARDIIGSLGQAIAILNHPQVRAALGARSMWDAVAAIDRRFRRPVRPTLSHLRRGRAGMTVLAWLADVSDDLTRGGAPVLGPNDSVIDAAVDWVDETLSIVRAEEGAAGGARTGASGAPGTSTPGEPAWADLAR